MPSAVPPQDRADPSRPDDLDRLLDYDNAVEDFMRDIPTGGDDQQQNNAANEQARDEDQEVQVKRKRQPIPKLDENRLLSNAGIPKLRKITKSRLKFRGKGHEFTDISRLLNTYQLWLDDLYPRAKFRDALTMVEKVGHSKRMQIMRKGWLDDTKPGRRDESPGPTMPGRRDKSPDPTMPGGSGIDRATDNHLFGGENTEHHEDGAPAVDELDYLLAENQADSIMRAKLEQRHRASLVEEGEPDEDELDALLAQARSSEPSQDAPNPVQRRPFVEDDGDDPDEDELGALMAEQESDRMRPIGAPGKLDDAALPVNRIMDVFADDEEAMAGMGGAW